MVLLPEDTSMTLAELRQMAARQQHQIEAQQQLLVAKEQRLKFLKQQEARHHNLAEHNLDTVCLKNLQDKVQKQEMKLRQLRALRGQVEQQKTNNGNLGTELDSIRALFSEKEKELNLAITKVEELTRQLDEVRNHKNINSTLSPTALELDMLRKKLMNQTKISEQKNIFIVKQRNDIAVCQQNISELDAKIEELTLRLNKKRTLNEQLASQVRISSHPNVKNGVYQTSNIIAVEPLPRENPESQDDISAKLQRDHSEFNLTKNDPKYQTLPYNTKFSLKWKTEEVSSNEEDSFPNSLDSNSSSKKPPPPLSVVKPTAIVPKMIPTRNGASNTETSGKVTEDNVVPLQTQKNDSAEAKRLERNSPTKNSNNISKPNPVKDSTNDKIKPTITRSKPIVPPKPAFPVKPMVARPNHLNLNKTKLAKEEDLVNTAMSILQKKSTSSEKLAISNYRKRLLYYQCIPRYNTPKDSPIQEIPSTTSKLATYFQKTILQASDSSSQDRNAESADKKRSSPGLLPIKAKPLTIRKTPGLEPPKLKVLPISSVITGRKLPDPMHYSARSRQGTNPSEEAISDIERQVNAARIDDDIVIVEVQGDSSRISEVGGLWGQVDSQTDKEEEEGSDEIDFIRKNLIVENVESSDFSEKDTEEENEDDIFHSSDKHKIPKGNLKDENSLRRGRRVSFDPLALLLDAALEGELDLVKKTAIEVPNPSAANDEGITALHNAICAGHTEVVTFLVEFGCDLNAQDSDGWTPLHCAASCNNLSMVKFLVERGACIFATTLSDHETAAEKCEEDEEGYDGCSEYLYSLQDNLGIINNGIVYAVYDYEVQNSDELSFNNGDKITVLRKGDDNESEWWWSRLLDQEGYVPRNLLGLYPRVTSKIDEESVPSE